VGEVIQRMFGVHYHTDYLGTLLHRLGWSVQKPVLRAKERDEKAIASWRSKTWPRLKKEPRAKS
jgi:transposase